MRGVEIKIYGKTKVKAISVINNNPYNSFSVICSDSQCVWTGSIQTRRLNQREKTIFFHFKFHDLGNSDGNVGDYGDGDYDEAGGLFDSGSGGSLEESVPGVPGEDYPIFSEVPDTSFTCDGQVEGGYYADPEAECQAFHICGSDGDGGLNKFSFLCPNGTLMNQQYFVCDWWFNVDCSLAETLYSLNDEVAAERESYAGNTGDDEGYQGDAGQQQAGEARRPGQGQTRTSGRGAGAGGQGEYRGAGARRTSGGGETPAGRTRGRGGAQRGSSGRGGQRTKSGYLAPASTGDYEDDVSADVGYGAPGGDQDNFEGAGDFPLLTEYSRNTRNTELGQSQEEDNQIEIIEVE